MAIITDASKAVPTTWSNEECQQLFEHARELGQNGNPAGYFLTVSLHPYVGIYTPEGNRIKAYADWDYEKIRVWIAGHTEKAQRIWQSKFVGWNE